MNKLFKNSFIALILFPMAIFAQSQTYIHALSLKSSLMQYPHKITESWDQHLVKKLAAIQNNSVDSGKICKGQEGCASGIFSFYNEAEGLMNVLIQEQPVIKQCHNQMQCIAKQSNVVAYQMLGEDIGHLNHYVTHYLF